MATLAVRDIAPDEASVPVSRSVTQSWPLYAVLCSSACIVVGLLWDISWHSTVGRDTFWTLPHLLEQFGALLAGCSCGWLVLNTTFRGSPAQQAECVRFWGFRGPLGAWVTIWGTIVMITSAPFDNWWHNAYGLDVRIVSPPHMVLGLGMFGIQAGALLFALGAQNRAVDASAMRKFGWIYTAAAGVLVCMLATLTSEYASRANDMHNALFYQVAGGALPIALVAVARAGRLRFPATKAAAVYMAIVLVMMWTLQLFPATPKLAPIYNAVTHMIPPEFPLLLVVPAFAIDLLVRWNAGRHDWLTSVALGCVFVVLLAGVQWYFGDFLLSPKARNFLFAGDQWAYMVRPGAFRHEFWNVARDAAGHPSFSRFLEGLGIAALLASAASRIGLWIGNGMSRVMR
ncbi:MAG TPA: hypothetical protein VIB98_00465 [Gemmatimonadaceae bacterium]